MRLILGLTAMMVTLAYSAAALFTLCTWMIQP